MWKEVTEDHIIQEGDRVKIRLTIRGYGFEPEYIKDRISDLIWERFLDRGDIIEYVSSWIEEIEEIESGLLKGLKRFSLGFEIVFIKGLDPIPLSVIIMIIIGVLTLLMREIRYLYLVITDKKLYVETIEREKPPIPVGVGVGLGLLLLILFILSRGGRT